FFGHILRNCAGRIDSSSQNNEARQNRYDFSRPWREVLLYTAIPGIAHTGMKRGIRSRSHKPLKLTVKGDVATLDLRNKPTNIIDFDLIAEFSRAIDEASNAKLLLLTTSLSHFSVGVDVKIHTPELAPRMLSDFHKVIRKLYHFPGVTACLIKGFALGGGLELALVCDFISADQEA